MREPLVAKLSGSSSKTATFYFRTREDREKAYNILADHHFYFPYGPNLSMKEIDDPEYMLELLETAGFDTTTILVEKESNPQVLGVRGVDASLEKMKEEKKREWRARGYSESLISMATDLAQEWAYRMSEVFAPPELREAAIRYNLPKGLEVADRWIKTIGEAVKA